jgi:hypothetical protein
MSKTRTLAEWSAAVERVELTLQGLERDVLDLGDVPGDGGQDERRQALLVAWRYLAGPIALSGQYAGAAAARELASRVTIVANKLPKLASECSRSGMASSQF